MNNATHIQLVTIAPQENDAASIEAFLRDNGHPVRMHWLQASDSLEDRLKELWPDMIFCDGSNPKLRDYSLHCCNKAAPEIPVLLLAREINAEAVETALLKRARDAVSPHHLQHLQGVYLRELAAAKLESSLREAKQELAKLQSRLSSLVSVSQLAVATVQDGILLNASADFAALFGYESPDELNAQPFLELIAKEQRPLIKKQLNRCSTGKAITDQTETLGLAADGSSFEVELRMARVESPEGEAIEIQAKREEVQAIEQASTVVTGPDSAAEDAPETVAPAEAEVEPAEEEIPVTLKIDEAESKRIALALEARRHRIILNPFISLDGQQASCSDALLELQDENGQWFCPAPSSDRLLSTEVQQGLDNRILEESCILLNQMLKDGQPGTLLTPISTASLSQGEQLSSLLSKAAKPAIAGGQNLVITLNEQAFSKHIDEAQQFIELLRKVDLRLAIDCGRANPTTVAMMQALQPNFICLDRSATQLLVSQGSDNKELSKIMQYSRDHGMHIVAFPLQDAHSMAMLWQRGVNLVRGGLLNQVAA